jgi:ABC-type uncharacterized transport system permease subunit
MDNTETKTKEPLIRIVKRDDLSLKQRILVRVICILIAAFLCVIAIWIIGRKNPFPAVAIIFNGTFGNKAKFNQTLQETVLLLGVGVALCPAYEMKFWNVGAQGQILMGALGAAIVMIYCSALPNGLVIVLSLFAALLFGGLWGLIPAFCKAKWNTNETLFTLMMNYIAIQLVSFATYNWKGANSSMGFINKGSRTGWLVNIASNQVILPTIIILCFVVLMFIYLNKTKHGYELKVIGESVNTARYTGIKVKWVIMRTLILSGCLCGLIGFLYTTGIDHSISTETSGGDGFTAIIVCWLAYFNPLLMIIYSFLIVFLNRGAINLKNQSYAASLNEYSCELLILIVILALMLSEFFIRYTLVFRHKEEKTEQKKEVKAHE